METVDYYHKTLHLGCCSSPRSTSETKPECLINYVIPKLLPVQISEDTNNCSVPEPTLEQEAIIINNIDQFQDGNVPNDGVRIDDKNDCEYHHIMMNCKIRALYDNGWHQGTIRWYNSKIDQYRVLFPHGTDDYIGLDDIDIIIQINRRATRNHSGQWKFLGIGALR